jgi:hypothetical protein
MLCTCIYLDVKELIYIYVCNKLLSNYKSWITTNVNILYLWQYLLFFLWFWWYVFITNVLYIMYIYACSGKKTFKLIYEKTCEITFHSSKLPKISAHPRPIPWHPPVTMATIFGNLNPFLSL